MGGLPYTTRTCDLRLRRPLLYPAELRAVREEVEGFQQGLAWPGLTWPGLTWPGENHTLNAQHFQLGKDSA